MKLLMALLPVALMAQTPVSPTGAVVAAPAYFSETGARYSYYDRALTNTTKLGIHVSGLMVTPETPGGFWIIAAIDATPRSLNSTAALRAEARYFIRSTFAGNLIVYANVAAGGTTTTSAAISAAGATTVSSSLLGNLQGGIGFVWRACHTFNRLTKVNCIVDFDYELNAVLGSASAPVGAATASTPVKPIVGLYVGVAF